MSAQTPAPQAGDQIASGWHRFLKIARKELRWIIFAVAVIVFLALLEDVAEGEIMKLDTLAYTFAVAYLRNDALTPVMESISDIASITSLAVLLLAIVAFAPGRRPGLCATVNLALVIVLNQAIKFAVARPRPDGFRLVAETGYSFPSGHSMVAMAFFGLLVWMVWHYGRNRFTRWFGAVGFSAVIALIGFSRVYLGVHYASDVIAGFCISLAWLAVFTRTIAPLLLAEKDDADTEGAQAEAEALGSGGE
ncbi:MAG: phosphatase PAP2 family protein [Denitrobacterium sp.]|jgi:membrane-associated phospholipid phosphatase|nr:phosphatase PAP2 family protein [Denitrobacterium sp.]MCI1480221.1 phosphatase PAP2 family protein [Eggerthellaceae bacterium]